MVRLKVRPKNLIGRDGRWSVWSPSEGIWLDETEDSPSEIRPKESDWTRRKVVRLKSVRRNLIGRDGRWSVLNPSEGIWLDETEDGPSEVRPKESDWMRQKMVRLKSVRRNLIGQKRNLVRKTMRPTCMSCQSDLIGRDGIWSYLLEMLLIGWSDGSVFKRLPLTFFNFSFHDFIQPIGINKKRYVNASSFMLKL